MTLPRKKVGIFGNPPSLPYRSKDNTGNIIHGFAAHSLFRDTTRVSMAVNPANLDKVRSECSHLAFVTATTLHPIKPPPYVASYQMVADFIEKAGLPVCTFGLGCHASLDQTIEEAQLDPITLRLLQVLSAHAPSIAVRGQFTADLCAKFGVKNVEVVGCQSAYVSGMANWATKTRVSLPIQHPVANLTFSVDETEALRLAMDSGADLIGQNDQLSEEIKLGEFSRERYLSEKAAPGEYPFITRLFRQEALSRERYFDYVQAHFHKFYTVPTWLAHMKGRYDFCFGTRFHGNMAAFMAGVPALWLSHDMRTQELCEHLNLPCVAHSRLAEFATVSDLAAECSFDAFWAAFPQRLHEFRSYLDHNGVTPLLKPDFVSASDAIMAAA